MVKSSSLRFFVTAALANQYTHWRLVKQTPWRLHRCLPQWRPEAQDHVATVASILISIPSVHLTTHLALLTGPAYPQTLEAPLCFTFSSMLLPAPCLRGNLCSPGRKWLSEAASPSVEATLSFIPLLSFQDCLFLFLLQTLLLL